MSEENLDLNAMSAEEIRNFIEGNQPQEEVESTEDTIEEPSGNESSENQDEIQTEKQPANQPEANKRDYDLELAELRLQLNAAKEEIDKFKPKQVEVDPLEAKLANYDEEDLSVIKEVIRRELVAEKKQSEAAIKIQRESAATSNEEFFNLLTTVAPEKYELVKEDIIKAINENKDETYFKKDWLKNNWNSFLLKKEKSKEKDDVSKRKSLATTETGKANVVSGKKQKSIESMTADEYLEYTKSQGLNILG